MPTKKGLKKGVGAICHVALKRLHPKAIIAQVMPNAESNTILSELIAIKQDVMEVSKKEQVVIHFRHEKFENIDIYCSKRWVAVDSEGPADQFFEENDGTRHEARVPTGDNNMQTEEDGDGVLSPEIRGTQEDIDTIRALGVDVGDDNEPAPENISQRSTRNDRELEEAKHSFGAWHGIDWRKAAGVHDAQPSVPGFCSVGINGMKPLLMFLHLFPTTFLKEHIIERTNTNLESKGKKSFVWRIHPFCGPVVFHGHPLRLC